MPGCQTPLALSRMFPSVAPAEVQEALLLSVAPVVELLAGTRELARPRVPEAAHPTLAVQATPAGA